MLGLYLQDWGCVSTGRAVGATPSLACPLALVASAQGPDTGRQPACLTQLPGGPGLACPGLSLWFAAGGSQWGSVPWGLRGAQRPRWGPSAAGYGFLHSVAAS